MEEQEIHLRDYLAVIVKRRSIILLFFLIVLTLVTIATFRMTPIYQASTQVLVEKNESTALTMPMYVNSYDPEFYNTQLELIKSQNVARKVVALLNLSETYDTFFPDQNKQNPSLLYTLKKNIKSWIFSLLPSAPQKAGESGEATQARSRSDIIADQLLAGISVSPVEESRLININFQSENPEFARQVANSVAAAYQEEMMAIQANASDYAMQWMNQKSNERKEVLANAERQLQEYMQRHDIITVEDKVAILPQQLAQLTTRLSEAETKRIQLENSYNQIKELQAQKGNTETLAALSPSPALAELSSLIRKAEQKTLELGQKFGPKHPVMAEAQNALHDLQRKKEQEIEKIIASVKSEYELAVIQEEKINQSLLQTKQETQQLNEKLTEYNILKREVESNRALFDTLSMRTKEKGVTANTQKVNVWMTREAETPEQPIKPNKKRNLLLGVILGLFGGVGLAFFLEYLDNTIGDPEETEKRFGVSVLGIVELLKKDINPDTHAIETPTSSFAETFKALRTKLLLASAEHPPKILLVTSCSPQEGKTTTALNLAVAISQAQHKVLLIDADLRKPRLHKAMGMVNAKGLSSFLSGINEKDIILQDPKTGISLIPAGPIPPDASKLLGSKRFAALLNSLEQSYDFIIIDSPPVMSATDSLQISQHVNGSIVVCRGGTTTYDLLHHGLKELKDVNSPILGLIINGVDINKNKYTSYYGYYQYKYKEDEPSASS